MLSYLLQILRPPPAIHDLEVSKNKFKLIFLIIIMQVCVEVLRRYLLLAKLNNTVTYNTIELGHFPP